MSDQYAQQLKTLRERRGPVPKELQETMKEQSRVQRTILASIEDEAKTVPDIAEETGIPTQQVFWHITAMGKSGKVQDEKRRGDYMFYRKKQETAE